MASTSDGRHPMTRVFSPEPAHRRRRAWIAIITALMLSATACGGSAISPKDAAAANAKVNGDGSSSASGGTGTVAGNLVGITGGTTGTTGGTGGSTGGTGGSTGGTAGGTGGAAGGAGGGTTAPATGGVKAGSCAGFKNGPGITNTTITIGNSSDISGPVPGIFQAAQQATKAYVAYFNATSNICGRKLALITEDSRTDAGADQVAYQTLCSSSFAAVGSMSAFDSGGASTAQACGLPDIRTASTTSQRNACTTCFAAQGANPAYYENAPFTYFFTRDPSLKKHTAVVYLNAGGAAQNAATMQAVMKKLGATNISMQALNVSDLSYTSYVQSMQSQGVQYVIFLGPYQDTVKLQQTMAQSGFKPKVFIQDPTIYDPAYVSAAGSVGNGTYVYLNFLPFSEASTNKEMQTYLTWLQQVAPGANPTFYGAWAWSAASLFVQQAVQLGGRLNRANLVSALSRVHNWTDGGMTAPQNVGGKQNGSCWRIIQLQNGRWNNLGGYQCDGITSSR